MDLRQLQKQYIERVENMLGYIALKDECRSRFIANYFGDSELKLYPNPAKDILETNIPLEGDIEIYDVLGKLCLTKIHVDQHQRIDISSLPNGLYFLHSNSTSQTFIVNK